MLDNKTLLRPFGPKSLREVKRDRLGKRLDPEKKIKSNFEKLIRTPLTVTSITSYPEEQFRPTRLEMLESLAVALKPLTIMSAQCNFRNLGPLELPSISGAHPCP